MRAIVCDKCGKTILLEEGALFTRGRETLYTLIRHGADATELDLCEDCAKELLEAVRNTREDKSDG